MTGIKKERNVLIDVVKAFAIISVVIGHSIQYGFSADYLRSGAYFDNVLFKIIYSYHMPLFMLISGYLFAYSINRDWKSVIKKKSLSLLVPVFAWGAVKLVKYIIWQIQNDDLTFEEAVIYYLDTSVRHLWFLWAIFWCSLIVLVVNRLFTDNLAIYTLIFVASFFVPDGLNLELYKFMYPYFVVGYLFNSKGFKNWIHPYLNYKLLIVLGVVFGILISFYSYDSYIYTSGHTVLSKDFISQMCINLYRYIIGFVGSCFVILLFYIVINYMEFRLPIMTYIGSATMGIYVLADFVVLPNFVRSINEVNYLIVAAETIYIVLASLIVLLLIRKSYILSFLLLGNIKTNIR